MKTSNWIKYLILSIFTTCIIACTKEINNYNTEEVSNTETPLDSSQEQETSLIVTQNEVSSEQIPNVISHLRNKLGSKYFRSTREGTTDDNTPILDYEHITAVLDTLRNTNYSINFIMPNGPKNTFYNLVIGADSLGRVSDPIVVKYILDSDQEQIFIDSGHDFSFFKGNIALENYNRYFPSDFFLSFDTQCNQEFDENGDPLPCDILNINNAGSSGGAATGGFSGYGGGGNACIVTSAWDSCGGSNGDTFHSSGVCGGDGGGSGWVVTVDCPNGSYTQQNHSRYTTSQDTSECPTCNAGPSGATGVNLNEIARIYHLMDIMKHNNLDFTPAQEFYLRQNTNFAITEQLYSFWYSSNRNIEDIGFIEEALEALLNDGEVDFEEKIIIDKSFKSTKANCILQRLNKQTGFFQEVMNAFTNNNSEYRLKFETGSVQDGADAQTSPPDENGIITITFRLDSANGRDIEVAGLLLHEGVHAQLHRILASGNRTHYNLSDANYNWLIELNEWWKGQSRIPAATAQHDFMSVRYVTPMANAVRKLDSFKHSLQNYMYFGWEGLYDEGNNRGLIDMSQFNEFTRLAQEPLTDNHNISCD